MGHYEQLIESYQARATCATVWEDGQELGLEILDELEFNQWTAPSICAWLIKNDVEMTHKHHVLATRAMNGDTEWMHDNFGHDRVQLAEFRDRYVRRYFSDTDTANWQEALGDVILRIIVDDYHQRFIPDTFRKTIDLVHRRVIGT